MKPLIVLLGAFALSLFVTKFINGVFAFALSGRIAMSVMLLFTAIGHFAFTRGMEMMIPAGIPFKKGIVYFTGIIEVLAAAGLLIPGLKNRTAWALILFFILILPANIHAATRKIDYQKGTDNGKGLSYLWFRIPLQILFIVWTYLSAIRF